MKKIFLSLFLISFVFNFVNAEESKKIKQVREDKKKEINKSDEDFLKEFNELSDETKEIEKRIILHKEIGKTLDEMIKIESEQKENKK